MCAHCIYVYTVCIPCNGAGSPNTSGVKFYVHEPRTREEDGIREYLSMQSNAMFCIVLYIIIERKREG